MKQEVLIGQTDYTVLVDIRDDAGAPATGLTEASVDIAYVRVETDNDVVSTDVTPAALAALTDAHTDWGFEEVSATDHPGLYRLDIADAVFAAGAWSAVVTVTGTGLDPAKCEFVLVVLDPKASALPANYIANASLANDALTASKLHSDVTTELQSGIATAAELAKVPKSDSNVTFNATAAAQFQTEAADALNAYDPPTRAEATADKDEILADTGEIGVAGAGLTAVPWNSAWDAEVESEATDALNAYDPPTRAEATSDKDAVLAKLPAALVGGRIAANAEVVGDKTGYALTSGERDAIAAALLDLANGVETSVTMRQALRAMAATLAGDVAGGPGSPVHKNIGGSTDRMSSTADADGNRTVSLSL